MNGKLNKPKKFGEMLDTAFQVCKSHFTEFFLIILIIVGPIYLLEAIVLSLTGTNFFSEVDSGESWAHRFASTFDEAADANATQGLTDFLTGILSLILTPVAFASILFAVHRLKNNQTFTVGSVMKQAFAKFWPILGSSLLFGLIIFGMMVGAIFTVMVIGILSVIASPAAGVFMFILLLLAVGLVIAYFATRWGFYLGVTAFENGAPGIGRSWRLTRGHSWKTLGLFLVFVLIFVCVNYGIEALFLPLVGESVFYDVVLSVVHLLTNTIFAAGYAVIYFDIKLRHDGDDLKELIDEYDADNNES